MSADTLAGASGAPAVAAIPRIRFAPRAGDYATGHPDLPGLPLSVNTLAMIVTPDATVSEINALLRQLDATIVGGMPGTAGSVAGLLVLRLPTNTHQAMIAALGTLHGSPRVRTATQDVLLGLDAVTDTAGALTGWQWDLNGRQQSAIRNWGLVAARVPQLWNLNAQVRARGDLNVRTGVLDGGFAPNHPDLAPNVVQNLSPDADPLDHGTHVSGIIGAVHNNRRGVDGVNPFAQLVLRTSADQSGGSSFFESLWGLDDLVRLGNLLVVNVSQGYGWSKRIPKASHDPRVAGGAPQQKADLDGSVVRDVFSILAIVEGRTLPFIAVSAGNDGNPGDFPGAQARFNSPFANAALAKDVKAITVIESDSASATAAASSPSYAISSLSNVGGHLSAPGSGIWNLIVPPTSFGALSGTSMATPHVAGVAGYLYSLVPSFPRPTLDANPMRDLLVATSRHPAGAPFNGRPMLDAFAAALTIDSVLGQERVLPLLLDIDDGSEDGNQRVVPGTDVVSIADNPAADQSIDMKDFRRWRDWLLQVEDNVDLFLDGSPLNGKKDPNGDGRVGTAAEEALFPRGDFNGDGKLSREATDVAVVPGVLRSGGALTDLEVLQARFQDPNYVAADLDSLIDSGDLRFEVRACQEVRGALSVQLEVRGEADGGLRQQRTVAITAPAAQILSVRVTGTPLRLVARAVGASGTLDTRDTVVVLSLGGDVRWTPPCVAPPLTVTVSPATVTLAPGATQQFTAAVTGTSDTQVTWSATGGTISASGLFTAPATAGPVTVTARSVVDPTRSGSAQVTVASALFNPSGLYSGVLTSNPSDPNTYFYWVQRIPGTDNFQISRDRSTRGGVAPTVPTPIPCPQRPGDINNVECSPPLALVQVDSIAYSFGPATVSVLIGPDSSGETCTSTGTHSGEFTTPTVFGTMNFNLRHSLALFSCTFPSSGRDPIVATIVFQGRRISTLP